MELLGLFPSSVNPASQITKGLGYKVRRILTWSCLGFVSGDIVILLGAVIGQIMRVTGRWEPRPWCKLYAAHHLLIRAAHISKPWFPSSLKQRDKGSVNSACQIFIQDHGTPEWTCYWFYFSMLLYNICSIIFQKEITVQLKSRNNSLIGIEIKNYLMIMMIHSTEWIQKYLLDAKFVFIHGYTFFGVPSTRNHIYLAHLHIFCQVVIHNYKKWGIHISGEGQSTESAMVWTFFATSDMGNLGQLCNLANLYTSLF